MKKLIAILTATMLVCGLCVAPAYAIGDFVGGWEFDFDLPEEPGDYEFHFYTGEDGQPELEIVSEDGTSEVIPGESLTQEEFEGTNAWEYEDIEINGPHSLVSDNEVINDDGTGYYEAFAGTKAQAISACEQYVAENQSDTRLFSEIKAETRKTDEWIVDQEYQPAWSELVHHEAVTHEEPVMPTIKGQPLINEEDWAIVIEEHLEQWYFAHIDWITVTDEEAYDEVIYHPAVLESGHYKEIGWASVTWCPIGPEDFDDDPVIPKEPNNDESTTSTASVPSIVSESASENVAGCPPQTGDHLGDMDSIIAITITACLAAIFIALCRRFEEKE